MDLRAACGICAEFGEKVLIPQLNQLKNFFSFFQKGIAKAEKLCYNMLCEQDACSVRNAMEA